jgi:hypothetical protein
MKHARGDYNRIQDPAELIPEDEPVFLIRGQDVVGASVVREWARANDRVGGDPELSALANAQADRMDAWPKKKKADA